MAQANNRVLSKIAVDAWILLSTIPLPEHGLSELTYRLLHDLTVHDLRIRVTAMPQPDWLPGNGKVDYFAQVILYDGTLLISGEPAKDKLSALDMLLWSIKARIAMKFVLTPMITTSLDYYTLELSFSSNRQRPKLAIPALRRSLNCDMKTESTQLLKRSNFDCDFEFYTVRVNSRDCQRCCFCNQCDD
ncbi:hypothetical protein M438DRAFT_343042 [Aureobasidium pullulans EXF-150]|uniref:Uncharacterized protein n=1 Tax=Aureobasidium pullulans EXF-150 TaxID=1043002 RepID=A0A074XR07_AURPU|nr:uncharacterized protein M438DRAFT_343042 [Aureobasidium pullulans EXF-150]KEQ87930.1 hypothetical protein M438DRAFT_343042 [Aureobasidium pullulans EXF-150]